MWDFEFTKSCIWVLIVCYKEGVLWTDVRDISIALHFSVCNRMRVLIQIYQIGNAGMLLQDLSCCKEGIGLLVC